MSDSSVPRPRPEPLDAGTRKIVDRVIISLALALVPISFVVVYFAIQDGWSLQFYLEMTTFAFIWLIAFSRGLMSSSMRALAIACCLIVAMLGEIWHYGLLGAVGPFLVTIPILGALIGGLRIGLIGVGTIVVALSGIAWVTISTKKLPPNELPETFWQTDEWLLRIFVISVAGFIGVWISGSLNRLYQSSIEALREQNDELTLSRSRIRQSARLAGLGYSVIALKTDEILECDDAFARMHGREASEYVKLKVKEDVISEIIHEDDRAQALEYRERMLKGEGQTFEFRYQLPDGQYRTLRKVFSPLAPFDPEVCAFEVICLDVSESRRAQEQLFQAQKMEAIGQLTGGVAHDFNNLLAVILGNLELIDETEDPDERREYGQAAIAATHRGAELTRSLLSFARQSSLRPSVIDINEVVRQMENWSSRVIPETIDVEVALLAGLWKTEADPSLTQNALLNLILNARDAMPKGGKITIETSNVRIDDEYGDIRGETVEPGRYVLLAVSDTGAGIAAANLEKIFEPFFTTKPVGRGSGLGLSMVQGFMRQSGGTLRVYSEVGVGTTLKLFFKAVSGEQDAPIFNPSAAHYPTELGARILIVEDEADVVAVLKATLEKAGHQITTATSGDEAINIWNSGPHFDLLLTDIVMPGKLQGTHLAQELRRRRPDLPVVFMSGYASEATVHGNGLRPEDIRLMKPVGRADLYAAVEKALRSES